MRFLVESTLKAPPTNDVLALFPAESARGAELDAEGVRESLFIAADNSKAWQVFRAASPQALQMILDSFPLTPYSAFVITPLADNSTV